MLTKNLYDMALQDELFEMGKERLTQLKVFLEELEVQMALGKSEAKEAFEKERKNFMQYITDRKEQFKKTGEEAENLRKEMYAKLEELAAVLAQDAPSSQRKFDAMKKAALKVVFESEKAIKDGYAEFGLKMQLKLDDFKNKLDGYRIKLALGEFEELADMQAEKEALQKALEEILDKLKKEESATEKIGNFADEINTSVEHLKKAFNELFS